MISSHLLTKIDDHRIVAGTSRESRRESFRVRQVPALTEDGEGLISLAVMWGDSTLHLGPMVHRSVTSVEAEQVRRAFRKEKRMNTTRILVLTMGVISAIQSVECKFEYWQIT